ncbi:MAG: TolC family protein [Bacteroidota bacterium]
MKTYCRPRRVLCAVVAGLWCLAAAAGEVPGRSVDGLLALARDNNPELAGLRYEAEAAAERVAPAGALADPKFRTELRDITRMGEQTATLLPNRVGSTRYLLMQDVPWFGKRDLKRDIAELEAASAQGRAAGTWSEVAAKIKTTYAQLYYLEHNERLTREILDLMVRLEKIAQARYAGGLAAQQDVIRAQLEQSAMRNELIALEMEHHHLHTRMNALLGRPVNAALAPPEVLRPWPAPASLEFSTLEARARGRNPLLAADESRLKAAEKGRELAYKNRYPDFTLGISPIQYQNAVKEWELMVELNIPLQQGTRRAQERESENMLSAARARRDATSNQVLADLSENVAALEAVRRSEALTRETQLPQSELVFNAALAAYENGKVDFSTLLDAQRQIRVAKQNQIKALAEGQARLAEIERVLGEDL